MCINCWNEMGSPQIDNVLVRYLALAINRVFLTEPAGGQLHVVLDDWNLDQDWNWFLDRIIAEEQRHAGDEMELASLFVQRTCLSLLRQATEDERGSALAMQSGYWGVVRPVIGTVTTVQPGPNPFLAVITYWDLDEGTVYRMTHNSIKNQNHFKESLDLASWLDGYQEFDHTCFSGWL